MRVEYIYSFLFFLSSILYYFLFFQLDFLFSNSTNEKLKKRENTLFFFYFYFILIVANIILKFLKFKKVHRSIPLSTHGASIAQPSGGKYPSFQAANSSANATKCNFKEM